MQTIPTANEIAINTAEADKIHQDFRTQIKTLFGDTFIPWVDDAVHNGSVRYFLDRMIGVADQSCRYWDERLTKAQAQWREQERRLHEGQAVNVEYVERIHNAKLTSVANYDFYRSVFLAMTEVYASFFATAWVPYEKKAADRTRSNARANADAAAYMAMLAGTNSLVETAPWERRDDDDFGNTIDSRADEDNRMAS